MWLLSSQPAEFAFGVCLLLTIVTNKDYGQSIAANSINANSGYYGWP